MLLAVEAGNKVVGIVTKTNVLQALKLRRENAGEDSGKALPTTDAPWFDVERLSRLSCDCALVA